MSADWLRQTCLSFPHSTEEVQWENHLLFKIGGKMFAITALEPGGNYCSLKSTPEEAAELVERPGIVPAPYLARAHWIALERADAVGRAELEQLLRRSYDLVLQRLPKKKQAELKGGIVKRVPPNRG